MVVGTTNFNGSGQFKFALVDGAGTATYWSNDGSSAAGSEPAAAVTIAVSNGLYSILLGDATLPNMTVIPGTVFNHADVRLRIWFNDGASGFQQLAPDQRIAAVGYAMMAAGVPSGAITSSMIANGAVGASQLATGAVQGSHIAAGAVGGAQLAAGAAALNLDASAGVIASPTENASLVAAGFIKTGSSTIRTEAWAQSATKPGPSPRQDATVVWTGTEFIVWGGFDYAGRNNGARYNPATGVWTRMSQVNAPAPRYGHKVVWTGTEMVVVGGLSGQNAPASPAPSQVFVPGAVGGGRYNPSTDTWTPLAALPRIYEHIAVWTGTEILILGGWGNWVANTSGTWISQANQTHIHYNPFTDTATMLAPPVGSPVNIADFQRVRHSGTWTGTEFIVWGGTRLAGTVRGFRYEPVANTWTNIAGGGPAEGPGHVSVWNGTELFLWGGGIGHRYTPASSTWTTMSTTGFPNSVTNHTAVWDGSGLLVTGSNGTRRYDPAGNSWSTTSMPITPSRHVAAWTGSELLVFGGTLNGSGRTFNLLHHYHPAGDAYSADKLAPFGRRGHSAVWTGNEMLVFGGSDAAGVRDELASYSPTNDEWTWLPMGLSAPSARRDHTAVWTGTQMIVWGGHDGTNRVNTGSRYSLSPHGWQTLSGTGAPTARSLHAAVWDGTRMLVWGGGDGATKFGDGAAFNPSIGPGVWLPINGTGAPSAREGHSMTWTGTRAVVWGGEDGSANGTNSGGRYDPAADSWTPTTASGAPSPRTEHVAVFGNGEIIITGGRQNSADILPVVDSSRYNPQTDTWTALLEGNPFSRYQPAAVWTGIELIVWGGRGKFDYYNQGNRFTPSTPLWQTLPDAPDTTPRSALSAVWTGNQMILHGGSNDTVFPGSTLLYTPKLELIFYTQP